MNEPPPNQFDAIVVGAGFSGLYMLHRLRELGLSARLFEAGDGVGGTWYWNRYPGARCDVESVDYSYSFSADLEQEWEWSERYPKQAEIRAYLNHVATRFDLFPLIQFSTRVTAARFEEDDNRWIVSTDDGESYASRFVVWASGNLTSVRTPEVAGLEDFQGTWYHTARWPEERVDFRGLRVGVIGTGSTGVQLIPQVAEQAAQLVVFQRTANFVVQARNHPLDEDYRRWVKDSYQHRREVSRWTASGIMQPSATVGAFELSEEERQRLLDEAWEFGGASKLLNAFNDFMIVPESNEVVASFIRDRIRETVHDPAIAEKLMPFDHPVGAKRICVGTDYYETYNRDNVTLVDIRTTPIERITANGIQTAGDHFDLDCIVFATGFDAMTGALLDVDIRGVGGRSLRSKWSHGPRTYLGLATAGFPNMFIVTGPGSPSVLSNMVTSIEQHVEWISDCVQQLVDRGVERIEASEEAEERWVTHVNEVADSTLFPKANSWYVGANVPGKPRVFMPYVGGVGNYRGICDGVARDGYDGFLLGEPEAPVQAPHVPDGWAVTPTPSFDVE